jgi:hypothetical protein
MEAAMASLPKCAVLFAILTLSSPLFSQVREQLQQGTGLPPAPASEVPPPEAEDWADDLRGRSSAAGAGRMGDGPACSTPFEAIFVFGGAYTTESMGDTADVLKADYDGNYVIGLGYQHFHWSLRHLHAGCEFGLAGRFGHDYSAEIWGGPTLRYDGIILARRLRVISSFTAGFSVVNKAMGVELLRERAHDGDASLLFYLGPQIGISTTAHPNVELFYRLHHRSGASRTLGGLVEGYNANVVGLRFRY